MATSYAAPPPMALADDKSYSVTLHTNHGEVNIDLLRDRSPNAVNNFVFLARDGFYDGVIFHRVISGFMAQGGDPTGTGTGGPGYRFADELEGAGRYTRGTVAMANSGPNTNGSQFFICHADAGLAHDYTIFGQVTSGMEAIDSMAGVATDHADRPQEDCVIESVTVTEV